MAKFDVVNSEGSKVSELELADSVFGVELNENLVYEVAKFQQINRRSGTVAVKNRSLVSGGGKKPWKQKGTGQARQGSIRASQWVGGGKAMGPKPRDYEYRPPRAVRRGGIKVALSLRASEKKIVIVDAFAPAQGKSKAAVGFFKKLGLKNALVVEASENTNAHRAVRNLAKFNVLAPRGINLESILRHEHLVLTVGAAKEIEGALKS
jgi:large subunit ribosomal protein L4